MPYVRKRAAPLKRRTYRRKPSTTLPRIRGKGAYTYSKPGPWGRIGAKVGSQLGKALIGPYVGGKAASTIGAKVGGLAHYIGRIFGSGDYVSSPGVKQNTILSPQIPSFGNGKTSVRIRHREYLQDVISSSTAGAFSIQSFSINPGISTSFPWLSAVCGSTFQQYRLNGMVFEYRSMSSDALNSVNTALGSVVMCTDYDSADAPFSTKQQMENTEFGVSCKPSSCMIHAIECAPKQTSVTELYVRAYANPPNTDIRLYDLGKFYIATVGFQGSSVNCGELWVSYDVTLIKAIEQPPGYLIPSAHYSLDPATLSTLPVKPLTTTANVDTIGLNLSSGTNIVFPANLEIGTKWRIYINHTSTNAGVAAVTQLSISAIGGFVAGPRILQNNSSFGQKWPNFFPAGSPATTRDTGLEYYYTFDHVEPGVLPTIQIGASSTPFTAYQLGDLVITQVGSAFV